MGVLRFRYLDKSLTTSHPVYYPCNHIELVVKKFPYSADYIAYMCTVSYIQLDTHDAEYPEICTYCTWTLFHADHIHEVLSTNPYISRYGVAGATPETLNFNTTDTIRV
jgi:hypothetical protein